MHSDDVYRNRLDGVITELTRWSEDYRDAAETTFTSAAGFYWKMVVKPHFTRACPFQILLLATPHFSLDIATEVYEDKPLDRFEFFPMLVRAIAAGHVEHRTYLNALTGMPEAVESRVELEDGWIWIGERRVAGKTTRKFDSAQVAKIQRFLPYRR